MRLTRSQKAPNGSGGGGKITDYADKSGEFKRQTSQFRNFVSNKPGAQFPAENGRYHLCKRVQELRCLLSRAACYPQRHDPMILQDASFYHSIAH